MGLLVAPLILAGGITLGVAVDAGLDRAITWFLEGWAKEPLRWTADQVDDLGRWFGDQWTSVTQWAGDTWDDATDWAGDAWDDATDWAGGAWGAGTGWLPGG